ncbi:hypothetical protein M405DRAFT_881837 [Rhizopogon salebrosus TDB-379]|nr:hypothetical protein M405DRAFT_881837 [Rhizopogon salebrosus TDB-379]
MIELTTGLGKDCSKIKEFRCSKLSVVQAILSDLVTYWGDLKSLEMGSALQHLASLERLRELEILMPEGYTFEPASTFNVLAIDTAPNSFDLDLLLFSLAEHILESLSFREKLTHLSVGGVECNAIEVIGNLLAAICPNLSNIAHTSDGVIHQPSVQKSVLLGRPESPFRDCNMTTSGMTCDYATMNMFLTFRLVAIMEEGECIGGDCFILNELHNTDFTSYSRAARLPVLDLEPLSTLTVLEMRDATGLEVRAGSKLEGAGRGQAALQGLVADE